MADGALILDDDEDLADATRRAAEAKGITVDIFVNDALNVHIVDAYEWPEERWDTDAALVDEAVKSGDLVSLDSVVDWMKSWFTAAEQPIPTPHRR